MIMKNYAVIENNIVVNIVVANEEWANAQEATIIEYPDTNAAHIGGDYVDGFFYPPKPFPSWTRNNGLWVAPISMPTDAAEGHAYIWKEETLSWIYIEIPDGRLRKTLYEPIDDEFID